MKTYKIYVGGFQIGTEELTAKEVEEFNKSFNEDYGSKINNINNAENLLENYKLLSNELKNLQSGTDEYKVKEEELKNMIQ